MLESEPHLSPSWEASIDEVGDRFENAWKQGLEPQLESFIANYSGEHQRALFRELLAVELELRLLQNEVSSADVYQQRFPQYADLVAELFQQQARRATVPTLVPDATDHFSSSQHDALAAELRSELRGADDFQLGAFTQLERIGHGGMGLVFKAYEPALDREVAIKVLRRSVARNAVALARFQQEAQLAAKLNHPHVVPIYRVEAEQGRPYLVMQYVVGESLSQRLNQDKRIPAAEAVGLLCQCLSALSAAHALGIVHRDIKPANLLQERATRRILISDFGLARWDASPQRLTSEGTLLGTAAYMSPEQCLQEPTDARADLYSLGVTFYHLISGQLPFPGPSFAELIQQHVHVKPQPLAELLPELPPVLCAVIDRLLEKDPADRYSSAAEVLSVLQADPEFASLALGSSASKFPVPHRPGSVATTNSVGNRTEEVQPFSFAWLKRKRLAGGLVGLVGLLALVAAAAWLPTDDKPEQKLAEKNEALAQPPVSQASQISDFKIDFTAAEVKNSLGMEFVRFQPGTFQMGSRESAERLAAMFGIPVRDLNSEYPVHTVRIRRPFYLGRHEVTQAQFAAVLGYNPSRFKTGEAGDLPVEQVTWQEAVEFCEQLSALAAERASGAVYALPTEAQWEFACRSEEQGSLFHFGDDALLLTDHGWFGLNSDQHTHAVGSKLPSASGIFDLSGNVAEWCADRYDREYYARAPAEDPLSSEGLHYVLRGGSWSQTAGGCRTAMREHLPPEQASADVGFRVVLLVPPVALTDQEPKAD